MEELTELGYNINHLAIDKLVKGAKYFVNDDNTIDWQDERPKPTEEEIALKVGEIEAEEKARQSGMLVLTKGKEKEELFAELQKLCDTKSVQAKTCINGSSVTAEQLARYTDKYKMAQEFKQNGSHTAELQLEADVQALTVDALADLIILRGDEYSTALRSFNAKVEAFRVKVSKLIDTDTASVPAILKTAKGLGIDTTDADIKQLLGL